MYQGAIICTMAGGLHNDVAREAEMIPLRFVLVSSRITRRVFASRGVWETLARPEDVAVGVHCPRGEFEPGPARLVVPIEPSDRLLKTATGRLPRHGLQRGRPQFAGHNLIRPANWEGLELEGSMLLCNVRKQWNPNRHLPDWLVWEPYTLGTRNENVWIQQLHSNVALRRAVHTGPGVPNLT